MTALTADLATMNDGCAISYSHYFSEAKPTLVLSNSLGTDQRMWAAQIEPLSAHFSVLSYDTRGHGRSQVVEGAYSLDRLGNDVIGLLDQLDLQQVHFCGLSIGGMVGQWLATHHADRIDRLVLANTAAVIGPASMWQDRINTVTQQGLASIWPGVLPRWVSDGFIGRHPEQVAQLKAMFESIDPHGYNACCAAIRDMDMRALAQLNALPTLVIAGSQDLATPLAQAQYLVDRYQDARLVELDAGHLSNIEQTDGFNQAVIEFLTQAG